MLLLLVLSALTGCSKALSASSSEPLTPLRAGRSKIPPTEIEISSLPPLPGFIESDSQPAEPIHPILLQKTEKTDGGAVASGGVLRGDEQCTMCQYFVQQIQADVVSYSSGGFVDPNAWLLFQKQQKVLPQESLDGGTKNTTLLETSLLEQKDSFSHHPSHSSYSSSSSPPRLSINLGGSKHKSSSSSQSGRPSATIYKGNKDNDDYESNAVPSDWGGRERAAEVLDSIPKEMRYISPTYGQPYANQYERQQWIQMYYTIYSRTWQHCRERVPLNYLSYCKGTLAAYPLIMQGLHWGDRPETICLRYEFCSQASYLAGQPHTFSTLKGDELEYDEK